MGSSRGRAGEQAREQAGQGATCKDGGGVGGGCVCCNFGVLRVQRCSERKMHRSGQLAGVRSRVCGFEHAHVEFGLEVRLMAEGHGGAAAALP